MEYGALLSPLSSGSQRKLFFPFIFQDGGIDSFELQTMFRTAFRRGLKISVLLAYFYLYTYFFFSIFFRSLKLQVLFSRHCSAYSVHWGIPLQKHHPAFSPSLSPHPLNLQTVQAPSPFLGNSPPIYWFFVNPPPLKIGFFSKPP